MSSIEFSREIDVMAMGVRGRHYKFDTTEKERAALAERYAILSVRALTAECHVIPTFRKQYKMTATFRARVVQACSISLKPIEEAVSGEFMLILEREGKILNKDIMAIDFDVEEEDRELLSSDIIDVGEMVAQHLSLEINPYPRHPDATGEELGYKIVREEEFFEKSQKKTPFDVLKSLKHKT